MAGGESVERKNLWAPWRIGYIISVPETQGECFICDGVAHPQDDAKNLVFHRTQLSLVILNRFPYNNGHLLIAPLRHIADLQQATDEEMLDLMRQVRHMQRLLGLTIRPHGFNVGINLGRCAGAGLPGHLHIHIVPRWNGDTSFMSTCTDAKVISQGLEDLLDQLKQTAMEQGGV